MESTRASSCQRCDHNLLQLTRKEVLEGLNLILLLVYHHANPGPGEAFGRQRVTCQMCMRKSEGAHDDGDVPFFLCSYPAVSRTGPPPSRCIWPGDPSTGTNKNRPQMTPFEMREVDHHAIISQRASCWSLCPNLTYPGAGLRFQVEEQTAKTAAVAETEKGRQGALAVGAAEDFHRQAGLQSTTAT
jgi:hypothetical protein